MLTIFIKAYGVNVVVNIKAIYLNKRLFSRVSFAIIKTIIKTVIFIVKKMSIESWIQKIYIPLMRIFTEHV